ncbi:MAG: hypothetical protein RLZZ282_1491 [Verrucomicrobiota bacterium]|jgi:hypothetical protein
MTAAPTHREPPWKAGLRGARANLLPGLVLQVTALTLVMAYYYHPPTQAAFERLAGFRELAGFAFGIVSTGIFGGLLPFLYLRYIARSHCSYHWRQGLCLTAFWSYKGLEVELWYRFLARVVGTGHDTATIVIKSFLDQALYCTLLAIPLTVVFYQWLAPGISLRVLVADFRAPGWYGRSVLPTLLANTGVWTPAVAIIYALPTPLQLPLQNLVLMFFTLLLAHLNARR